MSQQEESFKLRYEVIAEYPGSNLPISAIFQSDIGDYYDKFPTVFRKLNWWEQRKADELPAYLKNNETNIIRKFKSIISNRIVALFDIPGEIEYDEHVSLQVRQRGYEFYEIEDWLPSTEKDYNEFIKPTQL